MRYIKNYFKENIDSYTYLFFAVVANLAYKGYFKQASVSKLPNSILVAYWWLLSPLLFTIIFLVGSIATFKGSKNKLTNAFLWITHLFLCLFILVFSVA